MKIVETELIVLKSYSLAEADRIILGLSRAEGIIRLSVRGAKRLKSRFSGKLEPFTVAEVVYSTREESELGKLFQADVLQSYFHLAADLPILNALSYLAEILTAVTPSGEPNEVLFRMVRACFETVSNFSADRAKVERAIFYFEIWLLKLAGFLPDFKNCGICRKKFAAENSFLNQNAALVCEFCSRHENPRRLIRVDAGTRRITRAALTAAPDKFVCGALPADVSQYALNAVSRGLLRQHLEREPLLWTDFSLATPATPASSAAFSREQPPV